MNFFDAVKIGFVKYTNFSDRASRSEFWLFTLFLTLFLNMLEFLETKIAGVSYMVSNDLFSLLSSIFFLATIIPQISVTARRFHDVARSGWWILTFFTIIGILFPIIYWCCKKGDEGENRFGSKPMA